MWIGLYHRRRPRVQVCIGVVLEVFPFSLLLGSTLTWQEGLVPALPSVEESRGKPRCARYFDFFHKSIWLSQCADNYVLAFSTRFSRCWPPFIDSHSKLQFIKSSAAFELLRL